MGIPFGLAPAAKRLGLSVSVYASIKGPSPKRRSVYRISDGVKELFTLGATLLSTSFIGMKIAVDKVTTNEILRGADIPTTEQLLIKDLPALRSFYTKHNGSIILKPLASTLGKGIFGSLHSIAEAEEAFHTIKRDFSYVVAEKKVFGKEYRVLVFEKEIIAVAEYLPPTLIGNGKDTILRLIKKHNASIVPNSGLYPIPIKPELSYILAKQDLALDLIPPKGQSVVLYLAAPISHGGSAIDATQHIHPENKELFVLAAQAIYLNVAGIDVITEDIGLPLRATGGVILEINGGPDLSIHQHPINRPDFDAAEEVLRLYFGIGKIPSYKKA
ncbi:MAG: hypothetical protein ABI747_00440 [Candidatus Moraniibacteriota bacterium]